MEIAAQIQACGTRFVGAIAAICVVLTAFAAAAEPSRIKKTPPPERPVRSPASGAAEYPPPREIDEAEAASLGVRRLVGRRLILYTDAPLDDEIRALPGIFEQAFEQWCDYFGIPADKLPDWRMNGFLMVDRALFVRTGLLPEDVPNFLNGYAIGYELWFNEQPSAYYRRHLLLHEGTHSFMNTVLGGSGPPWYSEGMAELLATHAWAGGKLQLNVFPASRDDVPMWGRIKIVDDALAAGRTLGVEQVLHFDDRAHRQNEPYGWCWALATLLDGHPRYRERFRALPDRLAKRGDFTKQFVTDYAADWPALAEDWQLFTRRLAYGYDVAREAIDPAPGKKSVSGRVKSTVRSDHGWQNTGLRLEAGKTYQLTASGRYQLAAQPKPWLCEPNGVTIRYWNGRPLGLLLAAVRPDQPATDRKSALLTPEEIGLAARLKPEAPGTLFLQINDSPADRGDNTGEATVTVEEVKE